MERIRVLIADDHPIFREGMAAILDAQEDMVLVAAASDGEECVQKTREFRPEVIVVDLNMPVKDGLTAIREIAQELPDARLLVLTGSAFDEQVYSAIRAGALGFLLKDAATDQLVDGIRSVYHGTLVLHPAIAHRLLRGSEGSGPAGPLAGCLTARELDVVRLIAQGLLNKEIAKNLNLTEQTVLTHVRNIFRKLHVANRTQAAIFAREHGLG